MFLLLVAAALLYLLVGDLAEGIFLSAGALLSISLVIFQEARSERALQALNALAEPRARVLRGGATMTISAAQVVVGDLLVVGEGNRIAADALLISGDALEVDESALTGESASSTKIPLEAKQEPSAHEIPADQPLPWSLFAPTVVVRGQGVAQVIRTGSATEVGRIGANIATIIEAPTPLQRDVRRLIRRLGVLAVTFCLLVAAAYGIMRGDWFAGTLAGLTLAISLIPEEFPMVLTIFMAL
jgi:Ca2+-transporting ATPase